MVANCRSVRRLIIRRFPQARLAPYPIPSTASGPGFRGLRHEPFAERADRPLRPVAAPADHVVSFGEPERNVERADELGRLEVGPDDHVHAERDPETGCRGLIEKMEIVEDLLHARGSDDAGGPQPLRPKILLTR